MEEMVMTNKQFSGFVRLIMKAIKNAMEKIPEEYTPPFKEVIDILQSMLEDGEYLTVNPVCSNPSIQSKACFVRHKSPDGTSHAAGAFCYASFAFRCSRSFRLLP